MNNQEKSHGSNSQQDQPTTNPCKNMQTSSGDHFQFGQQNNPDTKMSIDSNLRIVIQRQDQNQKQQILDNSTQNQQMPYANAQTMKSPFQSQVIRNQHFDSQSTATRANNDYGNQIRQLQFKQMIQTAVNCKNQGNQQLSQLSVAKPINSHQQPASGVPCNQQLHNEGLVAHQIQQIQTPFIRSILAPNQQQYSCQPYLTGTTQGRFMQGQPQQTQTPAYYNNPNQGQSMVPPALFRQPYSVQHHPSTGYIPLKRLQKLSTQNEQPKLFIPGQVLQQLNLQSQNNSCGAQGSSSLPSAATNNLRQTLTQLLAASQASLPDRLGNTNLKPRATSCQFLFNEAFKQKQKTQSEQASQKVIGTTLQRSSPSLSTLKNTAIGSLINEEMSQPTCSDKENQDRLHMINTRKGSDSSAEQFKKQESNRLSIESSQLTAGNAHMIPRCQIEDPAIRKEIPEDAQIMVEHGKEFDFSSIKIEESVPKTRRFRVFKYKNPRTQRLVKILKCDHSRCPMFFRKWHNFFDHLRVHTGERPFVCPEQGCQQSFTQKANLNKHISVHQKRKRQQCQICYRFFHSNQIYQQHLKTHLNLQSNKTKSNATLRHSGTNGVKMTGKGERRSAYSAISNKYNRIQETDSEPEAANDDEVYTSNKIDSPLDNIIISEEDEEHDQENCKPHHETSNNINNHNVSTLLNASGTTNLIPCSNQTYAYGNMHNSSTNTSIDNQLAAINKTMITSNHEDKENQHDATIKDQSDLCVNDNMPFKERDLNMNIDKQ